MGDEKERTIAFDPAANVDKYMGEPLHNTGLYKEETMAESANSPNHPKVENKNFSTELQSEGVGWDGPADELNPMNWESRKKWRMVGIVSIMTFIT
jgi:hypothetical protein